MLPSADPRWEPRPAPRAEAPAAAPLGPPPGPVLICEEDRDARLAMVDLLLTAGFQVQVAVDARQALYAALGCPASCVILSLPLPGGDPEEVFRSIRGMEEDRPLPVIIISPPRLLPPVIPGFRPGVDQRLPLSLKPLDLLAAVGNAVAVSGGSPALKGASSEK